MIDFNDLTLESQRIARLESELAEARAVIRRQSALLSHYRRKFDITPRSRVQAEIVTLMEQGLRNCEIVQRGYLKRTVERIRSAYRDANNLG